MRSVNDDQAGSKTEYAKKLASPHNTGSTPVGKFNYKPAVTIRKEIHHNTGIDEEDTSDHLFDFGFRYSGEALKAQRQADLEKLSFHLGVDVKTLQGYLESKVSK